MMLARKLHHFSVLPTLLALLFAANPAGAATFEVTNPACSASAGGYYWAIEQANNTPGRDTIEISVDKLYMNYCTPPDTTNNLPIGITESVDIIGNGNTVVEGNLLILTGNGNPLPLSQCPTSTSVYVAKGVAFLQVGTFPDATGIEVTVRGLKTRNLTQLGTVWANGELLLEDVEMEKTHSVYRGCSTPLIDARSGSQLTLRRTHIVYSGVPDTAFFSSNFQLSTSGLIFGDDAELILENSQILSNFSPYAPAITWHGGRVTVVSSVFDDSGGFNLADGVQMEFVNSAFQVSNPLGAEFKDNIIVGSGATLTSRASTFYWAPISCDSCNVTKYLGSTPVRGLGFWATAPDSSLRFESTAIGSVVNPDFPFQRFVGDPSSFTSDGYTWVQPSSADAVASILPNALTAEPGLPKEYTSRGAQMVPVWPDSVLIEAVPDAGPGGVNELINPISGQPVTLDIYGFPRAYSNGTRNIGALQNNEAPLLSASGGDAAVALNWTPTASGFGGGYWICTSTTALPDPLMGVCPGTETTVGAVVTDETITGLVNGDPYWFAVRDKDGLWSNVVTATPMGPIAPPLPTAVTAGDGSLQVYWDEPSTLGGHTGLLSYGVLYRPLGTQGWSRGPQGLTARTTLLQGLVNGTTYEINVFAQTDDGGLSAQPAIITGTPQAAPTLAYAEPPSWPQNSPLTLIPGFTQLQGSGTYSMESGALPDGVTLNPTNGFISGTPTTQQSTSATIRLTDGATGLFAEATVALNIVAPSPVPELHYPTIQATVGTPASATPATANIPVGATYSVVGGSSLPGDFTIAPSTGVISGSPTSAPGQILNVDIQACWGSCDPNAGEVRITTMSFYILPRMQYPITSTATAGVPVSISPTVDLWSGGVFSISAGSLPDGLSLDPTTGVISGTPQAEIDTQVTVSYSTGISVGGLESVTSSPHIKVVPPTIALTYPFIKGTLGQYLSVPPNVSGLTDIPTYTLVAGSLPQGLSLDPASGAITGTPNGLSGTFQVIIEVTNRYGTARSGALIEIGEVVESIAVPALSGFGLSVLALLTLGLGLFGMRRIT
jgi:hypothetical protein